MDRNANESHALVEEVTVAERERQRALLAKDYDAVERLFADELVYVHASGAIHSKAEYMAYIRDVATYHSVTRDGFNVQLHGDVAVMTGPQVNEIARKGQEGIARSAGFASQVWVKQPGGWQMTLFHTSKTPG